MQLSVPNGYFVDNCVLFGDPKSGSILSRSYALQFPDLSASDDQAFTNLETDIRLMLGSLKADERLQFQFYTSCDYVAALDRYEKETNGSTLDTCVGVRRELLNRFRDRMDKETLIQTNVRLSISSSLPRGNFDNAARVVRRSFEQRELFFNMLLSSYGGGVAALDNFDHYRELLNFWSPSQSRIDPNPDKIDWLRPLEDLCRFSGLAPWTSEHGFYIDGYRVGALIAKTMPPSTWVKTMEPFLSMTMPGIRVVLNMLPLGMELAMAHERERWKKLYSNAFPKDGSDPDPECVQGLRKHEDKIGLLLSNKVHAFKAQLIILAYDKTTEGLESKIESLRAAIGKIGCESYQPALATSTVSFFNCATPGYGPWVKYTDYQHRIDDINLANLWPAGSTPSADLASADWICDGDQNNLIGGRHFLESQPSHMLVAGTTGSGKSSTLQSIALQSAHQFKFMVVIDDGLSWMTTCNKLNPNCKPIIIKSNGNQTFNIFDTRGLPLTSQHISSATSLCHLLVGQATDQDQDKIRASILAETITEMYGVEYRKWRNKNPLEFYALCERFDSSIHHELENEAFATWKPNQFPTLFDLQDELHSKATAKRPFSDHCATLAVLLRPWLRDGRYGCIVDGYSNVDLGSCAVCASDPLKVVHFELGELGQSEFELRAVAGFLIANEVRNHIAGMPRALRKQFIIEEMVSFLRVPNAEEIVVNYWQTMRKLSCQMVAVFQNYSTLLESSPKVAKAIVSNSSTMILLRNTNRQDLDTLSSYMPREMPAVIKDQITRFPKPASLPVTDRYAAFAYCQLDGEKPQYTVGRNYLSDEVEHITSSSGDTFEQKLRELNENTTTTGVDPAGGLRGFTETHQQLDRI